MNADDLTKTDVDKMSDAEVTFWFQTFAKDEQAAQMRKHMLDQIEIRDAKDNPCILPLNTEVIG